MKQILVILVLIYAITLTAHAKDTCHFVVFKGASAQKVNAELRLRQIGDDVFDVYSDHSRRFCKVTLSNSSVQLHSSDGRTMLFDSTSGSRTSVNLFDLSRCRPLPSPIQPGSNVRISPTMIVSDADCECDDIQRLACTCESAHILKVTSQCAFEEDPAASRLATRRSTRLDFVGSARVRSPGTPDAAFLKAPSSTTP